jgi:hypothetical protein
MIRSFLLNVIIIEESFDWKFTLFHWALGVWHPTFWCVRALLHIGNKEEYVSKVAAALEEAQTLIESDLEYAALKLPPTIPTIDGGVTYHRQIQFPYHLGDP